MEYKPGTMLTPWQAPSHFILPVALRRGTLIIPQIGRLRLEEDIRLVSGKSGSEPGPSNMKATLRLALRCHSFPPALNREKSVCPPWECHPFIPSCFTAEKGCQLLCYGTKAPWGVCCLSWRPICCVPLSWPKPHVPPSSLFLAISPCVNSIKGLLTAILGHALAHGLWLDEKRPDTSGWWKRN